MEGQMSFKDLIRADETVASFDGPTQRFLFLYAAFRADNRGVVRMPQSEIAELTLCSPRTVANAFSTLQEKGLLVKLGHGRYQIATGANSSDTGNVLANQLSHWIEENWGEIPPGGIITVPDSDEFCPIPDFFNDALAAGLVRMKRHQTIDSKPYTVFEINNVGRHLKPFPSQIAPTSQGIPPQTDG